MKIYGIFKLSCSYFYVSWMCCWSCLRLNNCIRIPPRVSALRLDSCEWQGVWGSMGKSPGQWSAPAFWNYTLDKCRIWKIYLNIWKNILSLPSSRDTNHCNVLRPGPGLLSPVLLGNLKGKGRSLNTMAKQNVAIPVLVTGSRLFQPQWQAQIPARGTAAEPKDQSMPVSVLPKDPSVVGVLKVEEKLLITATMVLWQQQHTKSPWFPCIRWFLNWRSKEWSARLANLLAVSYDQCKSPAESGD